MTLKRMSSVVLLVAFGAAAACADGGAKNASEPFKLTLTAPLGCKAGECKLNLTVINEKESLWFSLDAKDKQYVAVAFGGSGMMSNSSVIECVKPANTTGNTGKAIEVYHSTNFGPPFTGPANTRDKMQNINSIAMNMTGGMKDGRIFCSFMLKPMTRFPLGIVDFMKSRYFMQIASGEKLKADGSGIGHHNHWASTLRAVSLVKDEGGIKTADNVKNGQAALRFSALSFLVAAVLIVKVWL